jgi:hypothetical protein
VQVYDYTEKVNKHSTDKNTVEFFQAKLRFTDEQLQYFRHQQELKIVAKQQIELDQFKRWEATNNVQPHTRFLDLISVWYNQQ